MDVYVMIATVTRYVAPGLMELYDHAHVWWPVLTAAMYRGFEHTLFAPGRPGLHRGVFLLAEIKPAFIQPTFGVRCYAAVAVGLLEISAYLFEIRLISIVFGPLEIIHHHWPYGHGSHSVRI